MELFLELEFCIEAAPSSYNNILGGPTLNTFKATILTLSLSMEVCTLKGQFTIRVGQQTARECYFAAIEEAEQSTEKE